MRTLIFAGAAMIAALLPAPAEAQNRPAPAVEFTAGWVGFADDGIVSETMIGGAGRWYVTRRIGIGPELVYISGSNHSHFVATANVTVDLLAPVNGQPRSLTPFLVAGGGLFQTHETRFAGGFTSREGAFTAGGGVRAAVSDRVTVGLESRIGWEAHLRVNGSVGVRLGR